MTGTDRPEAEGESTANILEAANLKSLLLRGGGVTAGILAVVVLLRLMAVSGWNWHNAATVAETMEIGDVATIAVGTVFEQPILTGLVVMVGFPLALVGAVRRSREDPGRAIPLALASVASAVVALTLILSRGQWWLPPGAIVIAAVLTVGGSVAHRAVWEPRIRVTVQVLAVIAVAVSFVLAATVSTPWVPRERITTLGGTVIDGYVLEAQAGFIKVLIREKHELVILPTNGIRSRDLSET